MPEYLAPGVYVEEVSFRPSSIQAASTSVAAIVGPTRYGPVRGLPLLLTSYNDYVTTFGDALDLNLGGTTTTNFTAYAARAFFDNGGKQLYLSRIVSDVLNEGDAGQRAKAAALTIHTTDAAKTTLVTFGARFVGAAGNVALVFKPRRSAKLLQLGAAKPTDTALITLGPVQQADLLSPVPGLTADKFPLQQIIAPATHVAADASGDPPERYQFFATQKLTYIDQSGTSNTVLGSAFAQAIKATAVAANGTAQAVTVSSGTDGAAPLYSIPVGTVTRQILGLGPDVTIAYGKVQSGNVVLTKALNPSLAADLTVPLVTLAMGTRPADGNLYHDSYDISVEVNNLPVYSFPAVDIEQDATNSLAAAMPQFPANGNAKNNQPVYATFNGTVAPETLWGALQAAFDPAELDPDDPATPPRFVVRLTGGTDGAAPQTVDYAGEVDQTNGSFGLAALEAIDEISIVLCPAAANYPDIHQAVCVEIQKHCARMLYRVGILDSERGQAIADIQQFRGQFSDTRLALYYPWILATSLDPTSAAQILLPPSGFVAGVYANTDVTRGVHKAPANEVVLGALGLETFINSRQQEVLNPVGINCIRFFPDRGYRVWGGRTLADDPQWQYVNVRRYFLFLEHSISNSTNWVVFEPNGQALWANVSATVSNFLYNEWANGHLLGARPEKAYFVRCDLTTMTQQDLDSGRLVCMIGVAPLYPAEFVVFRIGQMTASA